MDKPYFCPNCRSNRVKFNIIANSSQRIFKDAVSGVIVESDEPQLVDTLEPTIQCMVCQFVGNELRFVKQAEREPRIDPMAMVYSE